MNSKKTILGAVAIAILIFNLFMFIFPMDRNINFWMVYVSSMTSIILSGSVFLCTLTKKTTTGKFNSLPLDFVAWGYLVTQIVVCLVELFSVTDYRISLMINVVLLSVTAILLSLVGLGKKEIERVDKKVKEKVFFIKDLEIEVSTIANLLQNSKTKKLIQDLEETIKYSDPMSHSLLADIENKTQIKLQKLKEIIQADANQQEKIEQAVKEVQMLLAERNQKARLYKGRPEVAPEEEKTVNHKAVIVTSVSIIAVIIIGITSYYTVIVPKQEYQKAEELLENKQYQKAEKAFERMEGYKDSNDKKKEAIYKYAEELFANEKYEEALEQYKRIENQKDCSKKIQEVTYKWGEELLTNKDYTKAAELFLELEDYKDAKDRVLQIYNLFGEKDVIYFGKYKNEPIAWQILDTREHKVLLITKEPIEEKEYNIEYKSINWENSSLRKWLNEDFYEGFDEKEKARLLKNTTQTDTIFLLSQENIKSYQKLRKASKSWWVAGEENEKTKATYVEENGNINNEGDIVTKLHGVRPSIWLNLD